MAVAVVRVLRGEGGRTLADAARRGATRRSAIPHNAKRAAPRHTCMPDVPPLPRPDFGARSFFFSFAHCVGEGGGGGGEDW